MSSYTTDPPEELGRLAQRVIQVVPYVTATLWKPGACHPESGSEEWGTVHKGRSASSIRQLELLLDEARAVIQSETPPPFEKDERRCSRCGERCVTSHVCMAQGEG